MCIQYSQCVLLSYCCLETGNDSALKQRHKNVTYLTECRVLITHDGKISSESQPGCAQVTPSLLLPPSRHLDEHGVTPQPAIASESPPGCAQVTPIPVLPRFDCRMSTGDPQECYCLRVASRLSAGDLPASCGDDARCGRESADPSSGSGRPIQSGEKTSLKPAHACTSNRTTSKQRYFNA